MHCEAKPVIDHYRLQKSKLHNLFDLYHNNETSCVVSGIGGNNMRSAINWAATHFAEQKYRRWINLGIAGHKKLSTGTTLMAHKISSHTEAGIFTPQPPVEQRFLLHEIISFTSEQKHYPEHAACDMEAFDFMQSVSQIDAAPNYCCIKIISDNADEPAHRNKARISALIAGNMHSISLFADLYHPPTTLDQ